MFYAHICEAMLSEITAYLVIAYIGAYPHVMGDIQSPHPLSVEQCEAIALTVPDFEKIDGEDAGPLICIPAEPRELTQTI